MVVIRHLIYRASRLSEPKLARCRVVPNLRPDGSWIRGRNGSVLVWIETLTDLAVRCYVVPGRQLGWQTIAPGLPWVRPPAGS